MGVSFNLVAVHIGARIALVGIADKVLCVCLGLGQKIPLIASEEAGSAASAQAGCFDLLNDAFGTSIDEHLIKGLIPTDGDVLLDIFRIDEPAIAQDNLL